MIKFVFVMSHHLQLDYTHGGEEKVACEATFYTDPRRA